MRTAKVLGLYYNCETASPRGISRPGETRDPRDPQLTVTAMGMSVIRPEQLELPQ
jgi:hypothetical protein